MSEDRKHYDDIVARPGKFEGEAAYVPYFWDLSMDGGFECIDGDEAGVPTIYYAQITDTDSWLFDELRPHIGRYIALEESEQGFVRGRIVDMKQIEQWESETANEQ